jgi:hypothetical protein
MAARSAVMSSKAGGEALAEFGKGGFVGVEEARALADQPAFAISEQPLHGTVTAQDHAVTGQGDAYRGGVVDRPLFRAGAGEQGAPLHQGGLGALPLGQVGHQGDEAGGMIGPIPRQGDRDLGMGPAAILPLVALFEDTGGYLAA